MFKWLRYLRVIPQVIGLVTGLLDLVRHAEDLLAGDQRGAEKKALVLGLLDATLNLAQTLGIPEAASVDRAKLRDAATVAIDTVVAVLNSVGVFKHGPAAPTG